MSEGCFQQDLNSINILLCLLQYDMISLCPHLKMFLSYIAINYILQLTVKCICFSNSHQSIFSLLLSRSMAVAGAEFSLAFDFFLHDISTTDAARITKHDVMFHDDFFDESCEPSYFGVKLSKLRVTKNCASMGHCTLVSAGFF